MSIVGEPTTANPGLPVGTVTERPAPLASPGPLFANANDQVVEKPSTPWAVVGVAVTPSVGDCSWIVTVAVGACPSKIGSVLLATPLMIASCGFDSVVSSSSALTVTFCGTFQFSGVKCTLAGENDSCVPDDAPAPGACVSTTSTSAAGWVVMFTVVFPDGPPSWSVRSGEMQTSPVPLVTSKVVGKPAVARSAVE